MSPARPSRRSSAKSPRSSSKPSRASSKPSANRSTRSAAKDATRGGAKSRSGAPGSKAKPRSAAAEKAIAARAAEHAARSVRKADRPGAARRPASTPASTRGSTSRRQSGPRGLGGEQVEGRQAVRELLLAGTRRVREVWITGDQDDAVVLDDIAELAMSVGVPVRDVTRAKLMAEARTEAPQGVLAKAAGLPEVDLDDLVGPPSAATSRGGRSAQVAGPPFLLLVDGVTDPGNLGALLRSAECAGVTGVVLPRHRAVHVTPTVTKAAAGAVEYLPMALVGGLPTAIRQLQQAGIWVVGLDAAGDQPLFDLRLAADPVALVLGAEGTGLSRLVRQRCDAVATIPLRGRIDSLNVAAAGALACFEVARGRMTR
jgi:23S rRNA (guanosine2251-2'-O)-methyltransferase